VEHKELQAEWWLKNYLLILIMDSRIPWKSWGSIYGAPRTVRRYIGM